MIVIASVSAAHKVDGSEGNRLDRVAEMSDSVADEILWSLAVEVGQGRDSELGGLLAKMSSIPGSAV